MMEQRAPKVKRLEKAFVGVPAGARLLIPSPALIEAHVRTLKRGKTQSIPDMRAELAKQHKADATCPIVSAILLRIIAELALEKIAAGTPIAKATPFWRVIPETGPLAQKLSCGPDFISTQRALEAKH